MSLLQLISFSVCSAFVFYFSGFVTLNLQHCCGWSGGCGCCCCCGCCWCHLCSYTFLMFSFTARLLTYSYIIHFISFVLILNFFFFNLNFFFSLFSFVVIILSPLFDHLPLWKFISMDSYQNFWADCFGSTPIGFRVENRWNRPKEKFKWFQCRYKIKDSTNLRKTIIAVLTSLSWANAFLAIVWKARSTLIPSLADVSK